MHHPTRATVSTLSLLTVLTLTSSSAEAGEVESGYDISDGEVITMEDLWTVGYINNSSGANIVNYITAAPRDRKLGGCDSGNHASGSLWFGGSNHENWVCQTATYMDDIAVESLYASMGLSDTFIDSVATQTTYTAGDGEYNSPSSDGARLINGLNNLGYAEQQLFSDAELFTHREIDEDRPYRAMIWAPACDNTCSDPIDWDHTWVKLYNSTATWADGIQNLLDYLDLGEFWNSNVYYLFFGDDNDADTDFKDGIAATLSILQASADESPLQSIFTKLTTNSYAVYEADGKPGNEQPFFAHFAVPDQAELESWAADKNYAVPEKLEWASCFNIDINVGTDVNQNEVEPYGDILDQLAELGMMKHYHVVGGGIKPFAVASGYYTYTYNCIGNCGSTHFNESMFANGFFFAYDPDQEGWLDLVDTGEFACSWDPDSSQTQYSSNWLDRDSQGAAGDGNHDWEKLQQHISEDSFAAPVERIEPAYVEMRRVSDGVDVLSTGDNYTLRTNYGGKVTNYGSNPATGDYEVRFHYGWTPWLDKDNSSGSGDWEDHASYTDWSSYGDAAFSPTHSRGGRMPARTPDAVECRALANPGAVFDDTMADQDGYIVGDLLGNGTNWTFRCSREEGYICLNSENSGTCPDAEARYNFGLQEICDGNLADGLDNGLCDLSNASNAKITAQWNGNVCLDVSGTNPTSNGTNIQLYQCDQVTETWNYSPSDKKIHAAWNTNYCLDVSGTNQTSNDVNIQLWQCDQVTETWELFPSDGKLHAAWDTDYCLDAAGWDASANNTNVQLHACSNSGERWDFVQQ